VTGEPEAWKETLIAALPHVHYESKPGKRFSYSNVGYAVLGAAVEQAAGSPYLEYLPQHIFLGLRQRGDELGGFYTRANVGT
jgi:CubicO group peptidase (beta-lactamase class C family)